MTSTAVAARRVASCTVLIAFCLLWISDTGFDRLIPGYPRYSMTGNAAEGIHNLRIDDARIEDDGDYQCQIGPGMHSKPIKADSRLTVLSKSSCLLACSFLPATLGPTSSAALITQDLRRLLVYSRLNGAEENLSAQIRH